MSEISTLTSFALSLAELSGQAILPHFRSTLKVDNKRAADWDPVTEGDRAAERVIRQAIEKTYPTHGIIGEEYGEKKGSCAYTWILDPIDGTRAFVIGMPTWTTLIALYKDGKPFLGLMNQPFVGEIFYGSHEGAFYQRGTDRRRLKVAAPKPLAQALVGTTSPHLYQPADNIENLRKKTRLLRYGGDAYFFALVAAGHMDIALDAGVKIYDIAALIPIVTAAGGVVGCWDDGDVTKGGNVMMASCQELFDEAKMVLGDERLPGHQTNMREKRIHIFGGPGSGTTTLGNKLGQTLQIAVFDSDTYYWENSPIAFTIKRDVIKRDAMLASELSKHKNWIISGSIMSWKGDIPQQFTHAIFLYLENETRMERLYSREVARFGAEAVATGGKRHQLATAFLAWAAHYDDGTLSGRSLPLHEAWLKTLHCPILRLNSQAPVSVLIHDTLAFMRD